MNNNNDNNNNNIIIIIIIMMIIIIIIIIMMIIIIIIIIIIRKTQLLYIKHFDVKSSSVYLQIQTAKYLYSKPKICIQMYF